MIPIKTVVDKANTKIAAGGLTDLEYTQLSSSDVFLDRALPKVVANFASLPSVVNNEGMIYYVTNEAICYFSDGTYWRKNFSSRSAVLTDLPIYAWGANVNGNLGDNTTVSKSSPVSIAVNVFTDWSQIASGDAHSLGITSTGIAYAWGLNNLGQLGDGTNILRASPVTVVGGITTWRQVAAGGFHSLGVTSTGIVYAWGYNSHGRLGDNTTTIRSSPVTVVGSIFSWNQIAAGGSHSLARTSAGIAYAWGRNDYGQIGDGTVVASRSSPVTVAGFGTTWSQVTGGFKHSLGITSTSIAYAWGNNNAGQLGDNTTSSRLSPVIVVGGITNWSQTAANRSTSLAHSLGLTSTGIAYAWGNNNYGRLGDNSPALSSLSPVTVVGGITNWRQVSAGSHSFGLTSAGTAYAWGLNNNGQLGDNTTSNRSSPVTVVGGITNWSQIAAGGAHTLGIFTRSLSTKGFV